MAQELGTLLDSVPAARKVLPHLAALESVLRTQGLEGLDGIPLAVLSKAHAQLSNLPDKPESVMLPQLLSLLDLAVQARQRPAPKGAPDQFLSTFMGEDKLSVSEISHTEFANVLEAQNPHDGPPR